MPWMGSENPPKLDQKEHLFKALEFLLLIGSHSSILRTRDNEEKTLQILTYLKDASYIGPIHDISGSSQKELFYSSSLTEKGKEAYEKIHQFVQSIFESNA